MDMRGLMMVAGAFGLMAAPVAWKYTGTPSERIEAPAADLAAVDPAMAEPAIPVAPERREMAGGAFFVSARD